MRGEREKKKEKSIDRLRAWNRFLIRGTCLSCCCCSGREKRRIIYDGEQRPGSTATSTKKEEERQLPSSFHFGIRFSIPSVLPLFIRNPRLSLFPRPFVHSLVFQFFSGCKRNLDCFFLCVREWQQESDPDPKSLISRQEGNDDDSSPAASSFGHQRVVFSPTREFLPRNTEESDRRGRSEKILFLFPTLS